MIASVKHAAAWRDDSIDKLRARAEKAEAELDEARGEVERRKQADSSIRAALLIAWPPDRPPEYADTETLAARVVTELVRVREIETALDAWIDYEAESGLPTDPVLAAIKAGKGPGKEEE
jgi:hypothetical protein